MTALFGVMTLCTGACDDEGDIIYKVPDLGVTRLNISPRSVTMGYADEVELQVAVRPSNSLLTWESSNPEIAYVDENNKIIPVGIGEVELIARSGDLSDKITASIHSSIVATDYVFMDMGATASVPGVQVLPEGMTYTIASSNETTITVGEDNRITAIGAGISKLHILTKDNQSRDITVGVIDDEHTITGKSADFITFKGDIIGHSSYNVVALALYPEGVSYADGGTWSGTDTGLFLKLYSDAQNQQIPEGSYVPGNSDFNYYTGGNSYVVETGTNLRHNISGGDVEITKEGVSAKLITSDGYAYAFTFSGTRNERERTYPYESKTVDYTNDSFVSGSVYIDHTGSRFYGGYTNGWQFKLNENGSRYIQIMVWTKDTDKLDDTYPLDKGFCTKGTIGIMGYGYTSLYYPGRQIFFSGGTEFKTPGFTRKGNTVTVGFQGSFSYIESENVPEINESRNISVIFNINVTDFTFNVTGEA